MQARGTLLAFAAFGVFWGAWGVLLPEVKEQTGASVGQLGIVLLCVSVAAGPAMVVTGILCDRFGPRVVVPALLAFGAAIVLPGLAGSVLALAFALLAVGAASGALDVAINVAATGIEAAGGVRLMQKAHALFSAGFLVAAVFVGVAREAGATALSVLVGCAAALAFVALLNRGHERIRAVAVRSRRLRLSRPLLLVGALCAVAFVVESGIENWSALFLESELDASPAAAGLGPGLFAAAMVAGRSLGQGLEERAGDRLLLGGGALGAGVGLVAAAAAPSIPVALVGFFLGGAGISVAAPTLFGAAGRGAAAAERGSAVASVTTIAYLGFLAGPPLIGGVSGGLGLRAGLLVLAAVAAALAVVTASLAGDALPLRRPQHSPRGRFR